MNKNLYIDTPKSSIVWKQIELHGNIIENIQIQYGLYMLNTLLKMLKRCPNFKTLTLINFNVDDDAEEILQSYGNRLERLTLSTTKTIAFNPLSVCPNLKILQLEIIGYTTTGFEDQFLASLKTNTTLRHLHFYVTRIHDRDYVQKTMKRVLKSLTGHSTIQCICINDLPSTQSWQPIHINEPRQAKRKLYNQRLLLLLGCWYFDDDHPIRMLPVELINMIVCFIMEERTVPPDCVLKLSNAYE